MNIFLDMLVGKFDRIVPVSYMVWGIASAVIVFAFFFTISKIKRRAHPQEKKNND